MTRLHPGRIGFALALAFTALSAQAFTYYVSPTGLDTNSGQDAAHPLQHLQTAVNRTAAGDTVYLMDGLHTYNAAASNYTGNAVAFITAANTGTAALPITYRAYPGQHPIVKVSKTDNIWAAFRIQGASYITIDGLELVGDNANITYTEAENIKLNYKHQLIANKNAGCTSNCPINWTGMAPSNTAGINVQKDSSGKIPHNIKILNNKIHDFPSAGFAGDAVDYVTIEGNEVYNTVKWQMFGTSGITMFLRNSDGDTGTTSSKNFIRNNSSHDNSAQIGWAYQEVQQGYTGDYQVWLSDANGIIIDTSPYSIYKGRTLIANNLVYNNGGAGVNITKSDYIDVVYNTASGNGYQNNGNGTDHYGELASTNSDHVTFVNNIAFPNGSATPNPALTIYKVTNLSFDYNVLNGALNGVSKPAVDHNLYVDPQFANRGAFDFRPGPTSPARDVATTSFVQQTDNRNVARPQGAGPDRGALERVTPAQLPTTGWTASASLQSANTYKAIDGAASTTWSSNASQAIGQQFQIDLGSSQPLGRVVMASDSSGTNYPAGIDMYVSNDPQQLGFPVKTITGNTGSTIDTTFVTKAGRYLTIKLNTAKNPWWVISEFTLYTYW